MTTGTLTLHAVQRIEVTPAMRLGTDRVTRDIVIKLEDGTTLTIELFTTNDELKLEIN